MVPLSLFLQESQQQPQEASSQLCMEKKSFPDATCSSMSCDWKPVSWDCDPQTGIVTLKLGL